MGLGRQRKHEEPSAGEHKSKASSEGHVSRRDQPDHDVVKVHVTPRGGLYVKERELLRSKGAREMMAKMASILREQIGHQSAERPQDGRQSRSGER